MGEHSMGLVRFDISSVVCSKTRDTTKVDTFIGIKLGESVMSEDWSVWQELITTRVY